MSFPSPSPICLFGHPWLLIFLRYMFEGLSTPGILTALPLCFPPSVQGSDRGLHGERIFWGLSCLPWNKATERWDVAVALQLHISKDLSQVSNPCLEQPTLFGMEGRGWCPALTSLSFTSTFCFLPCSSTSSLSPDLINPLQSGHTAGRFPALPKEHALFSRSVLASLPWESVRLCLQNRLWQQLSWPPNCCSFVARRHCKLNTQQKASTAALDAHLVFISLGRAYSLSQGSGFEGTAHSKAASKILSEPRNNEAH